MKSTIQKIDIIKAKQNLFLFYIQKGTVKTILYKSKAFSKNIYMNSKK